MSKVPFWAIFTRLTVRGEGSRYPRVALEANAGTPGKAARLVQALGGGRIDGKSVVVVEGRQLIAAARAMGYPDGVVDALGGIEELRGAPGTAQGPARLEERRRRIEALKLAVRKELGGL